MAAGGHGIPIKLVSCAKSFGAGAPALEPLDLEIAGGETMVILGPSGCGKTTTLRIIAGLESPDAGGRVLFGEEDVTTVPIERRNVGMVFQSYALFPNMTVAENVAYGLKARGATRSESSVRVNEMLAMMHIDELRDRSIDKLSGGQRQRVALARAIAVRPRVLLLDEPLTALDAKLRDSLRVEIDALLRRLGITSIYVTHDQAEAMALGDRIVVMSRGRVAQVGTPREIYFRPANSFVADFVGTTNRIIGTADGGRISFASGSTSWGGGNGCFQVLVRPHDIELCEFGAGDLAGKVTAAFFLGDRTRVVVEAGTERPLIVEIDGHRDAVIGEKVGLRVDITRIVTVPDTTAASAERERSC